jgi:hypothetical protein
LSFELCQIIVTLVEILVCTHDQDTRTPTNKLLTLKLRVTQKHAHFIHQIITPFTLSCASLSKISDAKKNSISYAKKRREKIKISMPKGMKKMNAKEHEEKKRKEKKRSKERNKDSPCF